MLGGAGPVVQVVGTDSNGLGEGGEGGLGGGEGGKGGRGGDGLGEGGGDGLGGLGGGFGGGDGGSETRVQLPEARFALPLSVPVMLTIEPSGKGVQELFPPGVPVEMKGVQ